MQTNLNAKSDVEAKKAFCEDLLRRGYSEARINAAPADVSALLDGERYYFEIKYTASRTRYFGAATLTEWIAALENPARFRFVIAFREDDAWCFEEYTVEQFMAFSYVPPFKIFFNVPVGPKQPYVEKPSRTVRLTPERLAAMKQLYQTFRDTC